jgi:hypothetical protein
MRPGATTRAAGFSASSHRRQSPIALPAISAQPDSPTEAEHKACAEAQENLQRRNTPELSSRRFRVWRAAMQVTAVTCNETVTLI